MRAKGRSLRLRYAAKGFGDGDADGECGGACACATCHVYVDEQWSEIVGPPEAMEEDMLDFAFDVRPTSRLSCQIRMKAAYDGLTVHVPERQA